MKLNKAEMKKVLGGGTLVPMCETLCWDGSILRIPCDDWSNCRHSSGGVSCGNSFKACPPQN